MKISSFWPREWFRFNIRGNNRGTSLIEVMIAILLIALVILGGGMFFFYGRVNIVREAHRRAALLVASQRLEALKAADWDLIAHNPLSYQPYYITHSSDWALNLSETKETVTVDNLSDAQMLTEAQYMDDDGMNDSYDYLKITVRVEWSDPATNRVSLTSLVGPP
jgi:Tfp pilus assembly protein PilV